MKAEIGTYKFPRRAVSCLESPPGLIVNNARAAIYAIVIKLSQINLKFQSTAFLCCSLSKASLSKVLDTRKFVCFNLSKASDNSIRFLTEASSKTFKVPATVKPLSIAACLAFLSSIKIKSALISTAKEIASHSPAPSVKVWSIAETVCAFSQAGFVASHALTSSGVSFHCNSDKTAGGMTIASKSVGRSSISSIKTK